jgi:hypothetical protein
MYHPNLTEQELINQQNAFAQVSTLSLIDQIPLQILSEKF